MAHTVGSSSRPRATRRIPAGDHADFVFVTGGVATIAGEVNTLVVIDGSATVVRRDRGDDPGRPQPGGSQRRDPGPRRRHDRRLDRDDGRIGRRGRDRPRSGAGPRRPLVGHRADGAPVLHRVLGGGGRGRSAARRPGLPPGPLRRAADGAGAVHDPRRRHRRRHRADPAGGAAERDDRRDAAGLRRSSSGSGRSRRSPATSWRASRSASGSCDGPVRTVQRDRPYLAAVLGILLARGR